MVAVDGRPRQPRHRRVRVELGHGVGHPGHRRPPVDARLLVQQRAARLLALVGHEHPRARPRRGERGGEPGGAGADDEHVDVTVEVLVAVGVGGARRPPEPGGLADEALVGPPAGGREHEGLVVEAGRHQPAGELADEAHRVVLGARPAVDRRRDQTVEQRLLGRPDVRHGPRRIVPELHHRVRLLDAGRDDAARPGVLEAAPDDVDAVGEQRRGERVAAVALQATPGERERQRPAAIDAPARGQAVALLRAQVVSPDHAPGPRCGADGSADELADELADGPASASAGGSNVSPMR